MGEQISGRVTRSGGKCIAVVWLGSDTTRKTLVESLTGTAWTISSTPPTGGGLNELSAASCASITECVAVGRNAIGNAAHPLVLIGSTPPDVTFDDRDAQHS